MQFLKDLVRWFIHGGTAEPIESVAAPVRTTEEKQEKRPVLDVVENILSEGRGRHFLEELKSIKPVNKQFEKDHADLVREVKRLSSVRKKP